MLQQHIDIMGQPTLAAPRELVLGGGRVTKSASPSNGFKQNEALAKCGILSLASSGWKTRQIAT